MKKKEDLRIIKTRASLHRNFLNLMKTKSFDEIKISELCSLSKINRSTFYDHYNDKNELLLGIINDLKIELDNSLVINKKVPNIKSFYLETLNSILEHINQNINIYKTLFNINNNTMAKDMLINSTYNSILEEINNNYKNSSKTIDTNSFILFYTSGLINIIVNYIKNYDFDKKKILKLLDSFIPDIDYIK